MKSLPYNALHPKKSLGQNFLADRQVAQRIISSLNLGPGDCVLEIGCGTGALSELLVGNVSQFVGIELDRHLFDSLVIRFGNHSRARFINADVLRVDLNGLLGELASDPFKIKVVGNLPFYISSPILHWLGRHLSRIACATIMLQSEVAQRLWALPCSKEYGVLTLTTAYYFQIRKLFDVGPAVFRPIPKVSSTLVQLLPKNIQALDEPEEFFRMIKQGFSHRRKTLHNCLKGIANPTALEMALRTVEKPSNVRAEELSLDDFLLIFSMLKG